MTRAYCESCMAEVVASVGVVGVKLDSVSYSESHLTVMGSLSFKLRAVCPECGSILARGDVVAAVTGAPVEWEIEA